MPKSDNQKLKIFYILDYLQRNSHQAHPVRASELQTMLSQQHNIDCDRKTIYSDIAALQDYGVDIVSLPGKGGGYYIASRNFELPELKLLIDAVQSSRFLTEKKSRATMLVISPRRRPRMQSYRASRWTRRTSGASRWTRVTSSKLLDT